MNEGGYNYTYVLQKVFVHCRVSSTSRDETTLSGDERKKVNIRIGV